MDLKAQKDTMILSTAYFPPISYFMAMQNAEEIHIENKETYERQSYRNRANIYSPNGKLALIIPVKAKNHSKIDEVEIDYSTNWQMQHWRGITAAYSNAAFFIHYEEKLSRFFIEKKHRLLIDFNMDILQELTAIFGIETSIKYTGNYEKVYTTAKDLRNSIHPKKQAALNLPPYFQVFQEKHGFMEDLSIIDYLFNMGPHL